MLALLLVVVFGNRLLLTGDEQRYLLYALSFSRHGTLTMPLAEWNQVMLHLTHGGATSLPAGGGGAVVMNGVYWPVILSPVARLFSLTGLRAATLLAGLMGLAALHRLLRRVAGPSASLAALFIVAFSMPLLPYLHLFYMETFLFALVCWAWQRLQTTGRGKSEDLLTTAILIVIPIVHMRGSGVAALLFAGLLVQVLGRRLWRRAGLLLIIAATTAVGFASLNLAIYGAVTGPVNTARPPLPSDWFPVLSMQLFNVHHGLFAYAPIWIVGYAGLVCGALRTDRVGHDPASCLLRQALALGIVAAVTGVGVNPGECWPARFWVLSTPMLTVGLAYWLHRMRGVFPTLCLAGLLGITAANTMLFVKKPNEFIYNRQSSTTYTSLFNLLGHVEANLVLPVETGSAVDVAAARDLALAAGAMILLLAASLRVPMAAAPALLLLLAVLDLARAHRLPASDYAADVRPDRLSLVLNRPVRHPVVEIGQQWQTWFVPPALERFTVRSGGPGSAATVGPANQTILSGCQGFTRTLQVGAKGIDLQAQAGHRLVVLESNSLLRRMFRPGSCREVLAAQPNAGPGVAGSAGDRDQARHVQAAPSIEHKQGG